MKAGTKKIVHTAFIALFGCASDVAVQLSNPSINITRALIVGIVLGALSRIGGALLAAMDTTNEG